MKAAKLLRLWIIILATAGIVLLLIGARWIRVAELPKQEIVLTAGGCNTPITILQPPTDVQPVGSAILIHGLSANRRIPFDAGSAAYFVDCSESRGHGGGAQGRQAAVCRADRPEQAD